MFQMFSDDSITLTDLFLCYKTNEVLQTETTRN